MTNEKQRISIFFMIEKDIHNKEKEIINKSIEPMAHQLQMEWVDDEVLNIESANVDLLEKCFQTIRSLMVNKDSVFLGGMKLETDIDLEESKTDLFANIMNIKSSKVVPDGIMEFEFIYKDEGDICLLSLRKYNGYKFELTLKDTLDRECDFNEVLDRLKKVVSRIEETHFME